MSNNNRDRESRIDNYPEASRKRDKSPTISDFFGLTLTILLIIDFTALLIQGMNPFGIMDNININIGFTMFLGAFPVLMIIIIQAVKNRE